MSFSLEVKSELCHLKIKNKCCQVAALCAWIRICGSLQIGAGNKKKVKIRTESYFIARWGVQIAKSLFDVEAEIFVKERRRLGKTRSFSILLGGENITKLLFEIGWLQQNKSGETSIIQGAPFELLKNDCCKKAFMRGMFIGAGSMSTPEKGYHLEMVVNDEILAKDILQVLFELKVDAKLVRRKTTNVLYLKESDKITEFLTMIGAQSTILDFESIKVYKDFRNNLNRQVNCETGNIQKTVTAATRQVQSIQYIIDSGFFDSLAPELRKTAEVRLNNPEASLIELAQLLDERVGKSGLNHRLRKLDEIAKDIKKNKN